MDHHNNRQQIFLNGHLLKYKNHLAQEEFMETQMQRWNNNSLQCKLFENIIFLTFFNLLF